MTWHQQKAALRLWHPTQWSVVTDPPNGCASIMRFTREEDAQAFLPKAGRHSYILQPSSPVTTTP